INRDHATATDLYQLFCYIQDTVKERFGVALELEVQLAGEF
ncbi:MAG: UDP-N-acetylmuramate dehydrogenase, partial [Lachnospiraceae bacterium]|nr:UDP-N-acetylmuramate dehydrogenase [Lachnospiraceae bacterium]